MAFGRRKPKEQSVDEPGPVGTHRKPEASVDKPVADDLDGPFDIEDFDDPAAATEARLDLGAVLLPLPPAAQLQVELTETGVPSAVWVVTAQRSLHHRRIRRSQDRRSVARGGRRTGRVAAQGRRRGEHPGRPLGP